MTYKILIVDDEGAILGLILAEFSAVEGCAVFQAKDGETALEIAQTHIPDIIVLDVNLPRMDGHEVCRQLRGRQSTTGIRVLMISGMAQDTDKRLAFEAGADDYLVKPFRLPVLVSKVEKLLGIDGQGNK